MKRILSLLFSLAVACSFSVLPVHAASQDAIDAANTLHDFGLFSGVGTNSDGSTNYDLDRTPTRAEAITMLVRLLGKENEAKAGTWETPFTDVAEWAKPYVGYAYSNGLTGGVASDKFGSSLETSATQYLTFVLRALGYSSSTDFSWDAAWDLSDRIGITSGEYNAYSTNFFRGDIVTISLEALSTPKKGEYSTLFSLLKQSGAVKSGYSPLDFVRTSLKSTNIEGESSYLQKAYVTKVIDSYRFDFEFEGDLPYNVSIYPAGFGSEQYPAENYPDYISLVYSSFSRTAKIIVPISYFSENPLKADKFVLKIWHTEETSDNNAVFLFNTTDLP